MKTLIKTSRKIHKALVWLALFALITFVLSAITHPLMVWTGPQGAAFMPPATQVSTKEIKGLERVLSLQTIDNAVTSKIIPTSDGPMLQITREENPVREYYSLISGEKVSGYDEIQAEWLARYYTQQTTDIESIELITEFSEDYSWVNRLIPVYKVNFKTEDNLSAYVYTETNALAGLNNNWKRQLQFVFQTFHTWTWLNNYPLLRVFIISVLLFSLLGMIASASLMLIAIKRKTTRHYSQKIHRQLAWVLVIPFLSFIVSGLYHLYQYEYGNSVSGLRLSPSVNMSDLKFDSIRQFDELNDKSFNALSIISYRSKLYLRAGLANNTMKRSTDPHAHHGSEQEKRNTRFNGMASEKSAFYLPLFNESDITKVIDDETVAQYWATQYLDLPESSKLSSKKITHFGAEYDFRNKRLPVWQFDANNKNSDTVFIDPVTNYLVDHVQQYQRMEGWSFSLLHKWNFFRAFTTREVRDSVMVAVMLSLLLLAAMGLILHLRKR